MVQNVGEGAIAVVPPNYCRGVWSQAKVRDLWGRTPTIWIDIPGRLVLMNAECL